MDRRPRILLIRLSSLGDLVLVTPAIAALREKFPQASISLLTKSAFAPLFSGDPRLDRVIAFEDRGSHKGLSGLHRFERELRSESFDILVDLHANLRSRLISLLSRARLKLRYDKRIVRRLSLVLFKRAAQARDVVDLYLDALGPLGITGPSRIPKVYLKEEERREAEELLKQRGRSRDLLIALAPGAKWRTKRWPEDNYSRLGDLLSQRLSADIVIVGDDEDRAISIRIAQAMDRKPIQTCGETSLRQLAALIEKCALLVSNDSGPMHLAAAVGTPVVAIFGPTVEEFGFAPRGERNVVLSRPLKCRPCSLHGRDSCPKGHFLCMRRIEPGEVFEAVLKLWTSVSRTDRDP